MSRQPKPSKKHHFVPQAQLRHFAADSECRSIWVFDKRSDRAWTSSILNAGSENDFNTVSFKNGKWNFEDLFRDVDARSARLVAEIVERRSLSWFTADDRPALIDLFATQILRTHFARTTPRHLAGQIRDLVSTFGYDPDQDPRMAMPDEAILRLGAVRSFLERQSIARSMLRLIPALFEAPTGHQFILSDDPVAMANPFPYGELGLDSFGVMALLPIAPGLAVTLVCPTIIDRYEAIDRAEMEDGQRARMEHYREGFRTGAPIMIEAEELIGWNRRQVARSARYLYASADDFNFAREMLEKQPALRKVESRISLGAMGEPPAPKARMPRGLHLVVTGKADHCMLALSEVDAAGEGLTAKTTDLTLLELVAQDPGDIRVELFDDGRPRQMMSAATIERLGEPEQGWFRVVHRDPSLRKLMRDLDTQSSTQLRA
jgi:hypothetical protein